MLEQILKERIVAIIRIPDGSRLLHVCEALVLGGIRCIEITMTVPNAVPLLEQCMKEFGAQALFGAGTVLNADITRQVCQSGARFVVSPVFIPEVMDAAKLYGALPIPGCFSPTEIFNASTNGAEVIKIFPANILGMKYFSDLRGPFPDIRLMPTGGVSIENANEWLKHGACAVGIGSDLVSKKLVEEGRFDEITQRARQLIESVSVG